MTSEPLRFIDDPQLAATLRGDLMQAATATVEGLDHTVGLASLKAAIATQAATATGGAAVGGGAGVGKIAVAAILMGAGAAAAWGVARNQDTEPAAVRSSAAVEPEPAELMPADAEATLEEPVNASPVDKVPVDQVPVVEAAVVSDEAPAVEATPVAEDTTRPTAGADTNRTQRQRVPAPKAKPEPVAGDRVLREAQMVTDARKALGTNAARALALTQQAAREFPDGQLVQEREAIAIRALAGLGRMPEARSRGERFLRRHASGPHADAVRRAIAEDASP